MLAPALPMRGATMEVARHIAGMPQVAVAAFKEKRKPVFKGT
jgi:hypothetical protein